MGRRKQLLAGGIAAVLLCTFALTGMGAASLKAEETPDVPTVLAAVSDPAFSDVPNGAWYEDAVNWCRENGIISGTGNNTFSPDMTMSRAMLATVLYRVEGSPSVNTAVKFSDVVEGAYYEKAVAWSSENGIMSGYGNGLFGSDDPVTREQLATILWRYAGSPDAGEVESFADAADISGYALNAVDWARANGIISGVGNNSFNPKGDASRAQVAVILYRYLSEKTEDHPGTPIVYMTTDISPEGLMAVYEALGWSPEGNVAVKLSTGEPPASNYLRPELIADLVRYVDGTIVECNTAYGGSRAETAMHYQVAEDHGFTAIANFQILDENGSMSLPVVGGTRLTENFVGAAFADYDSYLILSHFKGHAMAGFGGAIKNISIGLASSEGKSWIHTGGTSKRGISGNQDAFLESMGEAGKSVADALGDKIVYINVMNRLSVDCDCSGNPAEPDIHDIGILASTDPVALDQACIDLIYTAEGNTSLVNRIESRNGRHTLEHAEEIGLGSRTYELVSIDTITPDGGETADSGRVLVAYFSRTGENYSVGVISKGNTAIVAELIAEQTGADLFEIVPVVPYPFDYEEMKIVSTQERDSNARPKIANAVENWDDYDVVFLGYPIWYTDMPMIVYSFLESYDFSGKTVIPFNTHEGSGQSGTQSRIMTTIPTATVMNGLAIRGATAQNDTASAKSAVERWITEDLKDVLP